MQPHRADIVFHIDETLSPVQIAEMERGLASVSGVFSACVNERTPHLMVVDYDPETVNSELLLHRIRQRGFHAEMVGL